MRTKLTVVSTGLALCLLLTACGGGDKEEQPRVAAAEQCDGTLSSDATAALVSLLGTDELQAAESGGLERSARELTEDQAKGDRWGQHPPMCEVAVPAGHPVSRSTSTCTTTTAISTEVETTPAGTSTT